MSTQRSRQQPYMYRYGLRRQLLLNLGLVVLVVWGLLSVVLTRAAYLRFMQDRVRYILALSDQIDQIIIWKFSGKPNRGGPQLWFQSDNSRRSVILRPSRGFFLSRDGKYHSIFGPKSPPSQILIKRLDKWLKTPQQFLLQQAKHGNQLIWERVHRLNMRGQYIGTLWLSWDLTAARGEFFSYQGLLFFSLLLFGFLVLFLSMSFLERRLMKPLSRLGDAMTSFAEGQQSESLRQEVKRRDELGDLARVFVEMEEILQTQTDERETHIEELATANAALARAQAELVQREKMATVGRLAAGVAHEVGNPLSAIMGYSDLLKGTKEWGEMEEDLVLRIRKETERIDRIIRDLLDYARPVNRIEPGAPHKAIAEALELLRLQPRFKRMQVHKDVPESLPLVNISEQYLVQVLINLLINAADACDGEGEVHLTASTYPILSEEARDATENNNPPIEGVEIILWDTGPGIAEELRERLFEPFVTTKATGKGVGLGLALCHRWITDSGGQIHAEEGPEGGALFRMHLPLMAQTPLKEGTQNTDETPSTTHP